jgi:hypothetical protein
MATSGASDQGLCGASFHGGSYDTIGGRARLQRPEISPFWFEVVLAATNLHGVLVLHTWLAALQKEQTSVVTIVQIFLSKMSDPNPVQILGSGSELAKKFRIRPDSGPQHSEYRD